MTLKNYVKRKSTRRLALNKETIRDLTPTKKQAEGVRAAAGKLTPTLHVEYSCQTACLGPR